MQERDPRSCRKKWECMRDFKVSRRERFGLTRKGEQVDLYCLSGPRGMRLEALTLGATIHRMFVPDAYGEMRDIVLGKPTVEEYQSNGLGNSCVIGRYANRIENAAYVWKGRRVELEHNYGPHTIHGGSGCYAGKVFCATPFEEEDCCGVRMSFLDMGTGGFPGTMPVSIEYRLRETGVDVIYSALPSADTPISITSHAYFNLDGHGVGSVEDHVLQIEADAYLPTTADGIPTGEIRPVEDTAFDFRTPRALRDGLHSDEAQIEQFGGYDHNFCVRGTGMRRVASLYSARSGIQLSLYSDMPGVQFFTANRFPGKIRGKDEKLYDSHSAVCLETQQYPNAMNERGFPCPVAPAGRFWRSQTSFEFDALTH